METLPCGIYVDDGPDNSKIAYVFFEVVREDGDGQKSEVVCWAKYKKNGNKIDFKSPLETGLFNLLMPDVVETIWNCVKNSKPTEYPYTAEIDENTISIYDDGEFWLTLTNYQ